MQRLLVLSFIAFFSGLASASSIIAEVSGVSSRIGAIQLKDDGQLLIDTHGRLPQVVQLTDENRAQLIQLARAVAEAELNVEQRKIVCKLFVPYPQDLLAGQNERTLKVVLTDRSCAFSTIVTPKEEGQLRSAVELRGAMIALAQQLVK